MQADDGEETKLTVSGFGISEVQDGARQAEWL